eukprot:7676965-Pyramimonas_sp.AAC.1
MKHLGFSFLHCMLSQYSTSKELQLGTSLWRLNDCTVVQATSRVGFRCLAVPRGEYVEYKLYVLNSS